jgi:hypothetical protein
VGPWAYTQKIITKSESYIERVMGIEAASSAWEADVLPLSYTRAGGSERLVSLTMELRKKGLSWEAIARQWNAESILMLTGRGQWYDGTLSREVSKFQSPSRLG